MEVDLPEGQRDGPSGTARSVGQFGEIHGGKLAGTLASEQTTNSSRLQLIETPGYPSGYAPSCSN